MHMQQITEKSGELGQKNKNLKQGKNKRTKATYHAGSENRTRDAMIESQCSYSSLHQAHNP